MADCIPIQHRVLTLGDIHGMANWQFATYQSLLDFLGPFAITDMHKVAYVQESGQYFVLSSISPIEWSSFSVPTVTAFGYNTQSRTLVISMSNGTEFTASLSDIYTFATTTANTAANNAATSALQAAKDYTDQSIAAFDSIISDINTTIAQLSEEIRPTPKYIVADYTLQEEDYGKLLVVLSPNDVTISVSADPEEELEVGFTVSVDRRGTGRVLFAVPATDTLEYAGASPEIEEQYAGATFIHKFRDDDADTSAWGLYGRLPQ